MEMNKMVEWRSDGAWVTYFAPLLVCFTLGVSVFFVSGCTISPNEVGLPVEERGVQPSGGIAAEEGPVAVGDIFVICLGERRAFATQWIELTAVEDTADGGVWTLNLPDGTQLELSVEQTLQVWQGYRFQLSNPYHEPVPEGKVAPCLQLKLSA